MGYGSLSGRATTNASAPRAHAICDRCGFRYNINELRWQHDFRGKTLQNLRILVCETCEDTPQHQLKPRIIPPDPLPIQNARTEPYVYDSLDNRYTSVPQQTDFWTGLPIAGGENRITQNNDNRVTQQTGTAPGSRSIFPGVMYQVPDDDLGLPYGYEGAPNTGAIVEEREYVYWLGGTTGPMWFTNGGNFGMYWTNDPNA